MRWMDFPFCICGGWRLFLMEVAYMAKFGIVADDLTGATTVGVLLGRAGISSAAFFDEKSIDTDKNYEAVIVNTDSRALPPEAARDCVRRAVRALKEDGTRYFSKRIDTTLRGGIGFEIDAMLDELPPDTVAVMVPAMPQSRRIVVGGYSVIDGTALSETPVAKDVRTPVTESYIPALLENQTKRKTGMIPLRAVLSGADAVADCIVKERRQEVEVFIVDAISEEHVRRIAEAIVSLKWNVLAVDPGPFTEQLARARGFGHGERPELDGGEFGSAAGTVLVVSGSASPVTRKQMKYLMAQEGVASVSVSPVALIDREKGTQDEVMRVLKEAKKRLDRKNTSVLILETAVTSRSIPLNELEKRLGLKPGEAASLINNGLGQIVVALFSEAADIFKGMYLTGGDTMVHVLKALGAKGIELVDYVIPQADLGRIIGGGQDGLVVVGKGGLTGKDDTAELIVKRIFAESAKK